MSNEHHDRAIAHLEKAKSLLRDVRGEPAQQALDCVECALHHVNVLAARCSPLTVQERPGSTAKQQDATRVAAAIITRAQASSLRALRAGKPDAGDGLLHAIAAIAEVIVEEREEAIRRAIEP